MFKSKPLTMFSIGVLVLIGLIIRLHHISDNQFLFYDEGMYIGYNRAFLNLVANNPAHNLGEFFIILSLMLKTALTTAKALWFFILNLRVFILGPQAWYFARLISALSGLSTVVLLYFWTKRHFNSKRVAVLSALILLVLPSHVFYSRLGMQEALSTFLFLTAIHFYMLRERIRWPFFISAVLLVCVYLTNYRMIIAPVFMVFIECFEALTIKRTLNWKRIIAFVVLFYGLVLWVGSLFGGINLQVNLAWMFHQAQDADGKFNPINFLSYPYYVFSLEGFFFACIFWSSGYLVKVKEFSKLLPFCLVLLQMFIFSFAAEKGARYLCVVLPFMAAAAAIVIDDGLVRFNKRSVWIGIGLGMTMICMIYISFQLSLARTDYDKAIAFVINQDPQAVIVSTQPLIEGLFLTDEKKIIPCPNDVYALLDLYKQGARYLILDPQAYISWTVDGRRFSPPLKDFLGNALRNVTPLATFTHLNQILLNRFVLDHNEQIIDSLKFLSASKIETYGSIRVYDLGVVLASLEKST